MFLFMCMNMGCVGKHGLNTSLTAFVGKKCIKKCGLCGTAFQKAPEDDVDKLEIVKKLLSYAAEERLRAQRVRRRGCGSCGGDLATEERLKPGDDFLESVHILFLPPQDAAKLYSHLTVKED